MYEVVGLRLFQGDGASKAGQDHKKEGHVVEEVTAVAKLRRKAALVSTGQGPEFFGLTPIFWCPRGHQK